jgi:ADP-ribosyltransferase exoenzyme
MPPTVAVELASIKAARLNKKEKSALQDYSGGGYAEVNPGLRLGKMDNGILTKVCNIKSAISGLRNHKGVVYRGIKKYHGFDPSTLKKSAHYKDLAFLSASKVLLTKFAAPADVIFVIRCFEGKDISSFVKKVHTEEAEVLFKPSTEFVITDVETKDDGKLWVKMTELSDSMTNHDNK